MSLQIALPVAGVPVSYIFTSSANVTRFSDVPRSGDQSSTCDAGSRFTTVASGRREAALAREVADLMRLNRGSSTASIEGPPALG
jgi:hypothetical protein